MKTQYSLTGEEMSDHFDEGSLLRCVGNCGCSAETMDRDNFKACLVLSYYH